MSDIAGVSPHVCLHSVNTQDEPLLVSVGGGAGGHVSSGVEVPWGLRSTCGTTGLECGVVRALSSSSPPGRRSHSCGRPDGVLTQVSRLVVLGFPGPS